MNNNINYNIMDKKENSKVRDFLSLIPSTILTLVASLSEEDKRVLAYLISCSNKNINNNNNNNNKADQYSKYGSRDHLFECDCFECYVSFWARWDASEKRHVIHEIIEAYEEDLATKKKMMIKGKSGNRVKKSDNKRKNWNRVCDEPMVSGVESLVKEEEKTVEELICFKGKEKGCDNNNQVGTENKGSFRRFLGYVGEKVFAFWP